MGKGRGGELYQDEEEGGESEFWIYEPVAGVCGEVIREGVGGPPSAVDVYWVIVEEISVARGSSLPSFPLQKRNTISVLPLRLELSLSRSLILVSFHMVVTFPHIFYIPVSLVKCTTTTLRTHRVLHLLLSFKLIVHRSFVVCNGNASRIHQ